MAKAYWVENKQFSPLWWIFFFSQKTKTLFLGLILLSWYPSSHKILIYLDSKWLMNRLGINCYSIVKIKKHSHFQNFQHFFQKWIPFIEIGDGNIIVNFITLFKNQGFFWILLLQYEFDFWKKRKKRI